jgi:hypothetical protein
MILALTLATAHVRTSTFAPHVDTNAVGVVGDTLITYGAVRGFAALVIEDTEYPITPHSVHRVPKGAVHAVIGDAVREVVAVDEATGVEVGGGCTDDHLDHCCDEHLVTFADGSQRLAPIRNRAPGFDFPIGSLQFVTWNGVLIVENQTSESSETLFRCEAPPNDPLDDNRCNCPVEFNRVCGENFTFTCAPTPLPDRPLTPVFAVLAVAALALAAFA